MLHSAARLVSYSCAKTAGVHLVEPQHRELNERTGRIQVDETVRLNPAFKNIELNCYRGAIWNGVDQVRNATDMILRRQHREIVTKRRGTTYVRVLYEQNLVPC